MSSTIYDMNRKAKPRSYAQRLEGDLSELESSFLTLLDTSTIRNIDPNRPGGELVYIGFARWAWSPSTPEQEQNRMELLGTVRGLEPRVRLLFPHPTPEVDKRLVSSFKLMTDWAARPAGDKSVPSSIAVAKEKLQETVQVVRDLLTALPNDDFSIRLAVDTNALIDCPDLAVYQPQLGPRYRAHVLPIVLRELDDLKRNGRNPEVREAAKKADRRLKGLRDRGDVQLGVRVAGEVSVVFEHADPKSDSLPSWLNLEVPDDRFIASALLMQSRHPGSVLYVATSDLNLQTKLAAVGLPFVEPPEQE